MPKHNPMTKEETQAAIAMLKSKKWKTATLKKELGVSGVTIAAWQSGKSCGSEKLAKLAKDWESK